MEPQDLSGFPRFEGVLGALLIRSDGSIVDQVRLQTGDTGAIAQNLSLLIAEAGRAAGQLGRRSFSEVFLEYGDRIVLIRRSGPDIFVVLIATTDAKIGQILYQLKRMYPGSGR